MAFRARPEGLLAVAPQRHLQLTDHQPADNGVYIIAEAIEKPSNLGTLLRSADCAGVDGVIVCEPITDIFHPDVVRGSTGALFSVPTFVASTAQTLTWCQRHQIRTLAATPHAQQLYTAVDMEGAIAIVVGTEQYGLSQRWLDEADEQVIVPMLGQMDSLNVSMAATLLVYEAVRQRHNRTR